MSEQTGFRTRKTSRIIKELRETGVIIRIGSKKKRPLGNPLKWLNAQTAYGILVNLIAYKYREYVPEHEEEPRS